MVKLFGAVMVLVGAIGIGQNINTRIRRHYQQIVQLKELLLLLGNEMRYLKLPLPVVMERMAKQTKEPFSESFVQMADEMNHFRQASPMEIWQSILQKNRKKYLLSEEEFQVYLEAGVILEQGNSYAQGEEVTLFTEQVQYKMVHAQEELKNRQKVCSYLSAAAGVFLILILL